MPVNDTASQITVFGTNLSARLTMINFNPYALPVCCISIDPDSNGSPVATILDRMWIRKFAGFYYHKVERSDMFIAVYVHPQLRPMGDTTRRSLCQTLLRSNVALWNSLKYNDSIAPLTDRNNMTLWTALNTPV